MGWFFGAAITGTPKCLRSKFSVNSQSLFARMSPRSDKDGGRFHGLRSRVVEFTATRFPRWDAAAPTPAALDPLHRRNHLGWAPLLLQPREHSVPKAHRRFDSRQSRSNPYAAGLVVVPLGLAGHGFRRYLVLDDDRLRRRAQCPDQRRPRDWNFFWDLDSGIRYRDGAAPDPSGSREERAGVWLDRCVGSHRRCVALPLFERSRMGEQPSSGHRYRRGTRLVHDAERLGNHLANPEEAYPLD